MQGKKSKLKWHIQKVYSLLENKLDCLLVWLIRIKLYKDNELEKWKYSPWIEYWCRITLKVG